MMACAELTSALSLPVAQRVEGVGEPRGVGEAPLPRSRRRALLPPVVVISRQVVCLSVPSKRPGDTGSCDHGLQALDRVASSAARGPGLPRGRARGRLPANLSPLALAGSRRSRAARAAQARRMSTSANMAIFAGVPEETNGAGGCGWTRRRVVARTRSPLMWPATPHIPALKPSRRGPGGQPSPREDRP
jgi:hypothetical protein